ncbi:cytochrome P450 76C2-like [Phalaenopsis equestris]|uniref:cytochrome P450 76C2-like n=1 Tax=Phalaenopsis equestris TaxID=78828 RepID=UPI0009E2E83D|nr:cytochrome P450 76C2-like [Phalaenopsis equestris]
MVLISTPIISTDKGIAALLALSLAVSFLLFIMLKRKRGNAYQHLPLPPGPYGLPILGSLPFINRNLHHYFAGLARTYGPVLSLRLGSKLCVAISSPSAARQILKDQDVAFANHATPAAARFYFRGSNPNLLLAPYGPLWRTMRKTAVQEMLNAASIEVVAPFRRREMRRTVEELLASARTGAAVDVRETTFKTMLNMMTSMLWGERVASAGEGKEFRRAIEDVVELLMAPNVADFFPVVAALDPQGLGRRVKKLMGWIYKYLDMTVEKKKRMMAGGERRRDVLEALLDLVEMGNPEAPFTLDNAYKLMVDLIGAGTDSTSTTVEWAMAELLSDPTRMQKAHQELDAVVGKHRVVEESDIPQLRYICAVVKETFRLHPAIPLLIPHCPSSQSAIGGYSVPAGTTVFVNVWAIHRDPCLWGKDAEEFRPERFLETGNEKINFYVGGNDQFCYMPFGAGRRACAGTAMGERVVHYMLASLLHSFEWHLPEGASMDSEEEFGTVLRRAGQLIAVPTMRLAKPELYS